ncbi:unnamed protein product [Cylindrotheca closterium]|uniref:Sulfotransferase domain-containing protein n=1 Tax=Cylindrotheca closterium TaxID=2856 RepID=A0AAD2JMV5_9STRA|nr:unnamed protein product [Cylindrotheca closterium]
MVSSSSSLGSSSSSPNLTRLRPVSLTPAESFMETASAASRMKKMQIALVIASILVFIHMERTIENFTETGNATISSKPPHHSPSKISSKPLSPAMTTETSPPSFAPFVDAEGDSSQPTAIIGDMTSKPSGTFVSNHNNDEKDDDDDNTNGGGAKDGDDGDEETASVNKTLPTSSPLTPITFENKTLTIPDYSKGLSHQLVNFSRQNCDLSSLKSWYPESDEDSWEFRAPYFVIAGVWNSGSKTLAQKLYGHPQIARRATKTNGFYMPANFRKFRSPIPKVFQARHRMYAQAYNKGMLKASSNLVAMDIAPGYVFYAEQVGHTLLCVSPWTKIVILLRNPVERLSEQYARAKQTFGLKIGLEQWIANEMELITSAGLIGTPPDSDEEQQAWKTYQKVPSMANPIGRSLYIFQLNELLQVYKTAGKVPSKEIYIAPSEVLEDKDTFQEEYNKLLSFLDLSTIPVDSFAQKALPSASSSHMTEETRKTLVKFFRPYNKRLYNLLEEEGFPTYPWKKLWKSKTTDSKKA